MDRQFFPGGGFGHGGGFFPGMGFGHGPFFHPFFFPRRRFFPFFFLSPFFFPFFRGEEDRDGLFHAQHQCTGGETIATLACMYNCPQPILEAMNPHIQNPYALTVGTTVYIPRLDTMYCHKMYLEQEVPAGASQTQIPFTGQSASPYAGTAYPMQSGQ